MSVGMHVKTQLAERKWEDAEFPIVCEGCLGENPYVRMLIDRFSGTCKMCEKPFSVFKWRPGRGEGYRKTEVCQACARTKNLCQTCLLDMQLGLPSQLRDAVLQHVEGLAAPVSDINKSYVTNQQLALLDDDGGMMGEAANEKLIQIARNIHKNREQPRVKMFQVSKPQGPVIGQGNEDSQSGNKRSASEADLDNTISALPPGITSLEQLSQVMNLDRLPAAMKSFILKQYGGSSTETVSNPTVHEQKAQPVPDNDKSEEKKAVKKSTKPKLIPKPPAGPPPESALKGNSN